MDTPCRYSHAIAASRLAQRSNVRRHHRRAERRRRTRAAACLGHPHVHLPEPGENLALGKVPVANHPLPSVGQLLLNEPRQVLLELRRDRGRSTAARRSAEAPSKGHKPVLAPPAKPQYRCSCAVCSSCRNRDFHNSISAETRRTTQLIRTPLSTIARTDRHGPPGAARPVAAGVWTSTRGSRTERRAAALSNAA